MRPNEGKSNISKKYSPQKEEVQSWIIKILPSKAALGSVKVLKISCLLTLAQ
jgi:hypothetical protein